MNTLYEIVVIRDDLKRVHRSGFEKVSLDSAHVLLSKMMNRKESRNMIIEQGSTPACLSGYKKMWEE